MQKIINRILHPGHAFAGLVRKFWYLFPNNEKYLKLIYFLEMGHRLNLKNPQKFTEKMQWLKLYDRKPEYTRMVDKLTAKEYVAKKIGEEYVIPTIGVWNHFDEIDFDKLPEKFVLKTSHGSGSAGVVICKDKRCFDFIAAKQRLETGLLKNTYNKYREWPYKDVEPKILAEQLLELNNGNSEIADYKFFCFNGMPTYCQVIQGRHTKETIDFFDMDWVHQKFVGLNPNAKNVGSIPVRPICFNEMIEIAKKLSVGISFLRVDLYEVNGKCYFGEITLYPASGFGRFTPAKWDTFLGDCLKLKV